MKKRTSIVLLATLLVASGASALSLTLDTDKAYYTIGETIVVTATLDTTGFAGSVSFATVDVTVNWDGAVAFALNPTVTFTLGSSSQVITAGLNVGASNLTSFGGAVPWTGPPTAGCVLAGPGAGNTCIMLNQSQLAGPFAPDPATLVGTLELEASSLGLLLLNVSSLNAFGATPVLGSNFQNAEVVPEPTTAALLGLGLLGLGIAGRR